MDLNKNVYAWYAIYTQVNKEKRVLDYLLRRGIECYLPVRKSLHQWSDRKVWIDEPLFPRYVFVRVSSTEFFDVYAAPGVISYVMFGGRAQSVPAEQIDQVRKMISQQEREVVVSREHIEKGGHAEIIYGPFKGITGEVVRVCSNYRIIVRLEALGCNVYATVPVDELRILSEVPDTHHTVSRHMQLHSGSKSSLSPQPLKASRNR